MVLLNSEDEEFDDKEEQGMTQDDPVQDGGGNIEQWDQTVSCCEVLYLASRHRQVNRHNLTQTEDIVTDP